MVVALDDEARQHAESFGLPAFRMDVPVGLVLHLAGLGQPSIGWQAGSQCYSGALLTIP